MRSLNDFIRRHYSYLILTTVGLSIVVGQLFPAVARAFKPYMIYLIGLMIWAMSVTIRFPELRFAFRKGKLIGCGLLANFVLLPLLCYLLAIALMRSHPLYATGFILMGTVPCAGMNVVWTGLLGGDVALALVLGALTMLLGIVTIPGLTYILAGTYVSVNVLEMLYTLAKVLIIPILLGIVTRSLLERRAKQETALLPIFPPIAAISAMLLMFIMIALNIRMIPADGSVLLSLIIPPLLLFPIAFGGVYLWCDRLLRCERRETDAIVYSSGMKHLPLAMGIAFVSFGQEAALPIAVAAVFQTFNASLFYRLFQRLGRRVEAAQKTGKKEVM
ncbi:MAG: bile acid:sodium symporter [Candidatus Acetothermia bacterium]|jgi:ACR3 family arsenite efflux pump ArsB|nr:bile acid:sodium symporter [Candidatus Acetothermia bacterium]MDH7505480.1 bile acid:sodium symporter [Candidatus Acetothermia bacterium]